MSRSSSVESSVFLAISEKNTEPVELHRPLRAFIAKRYSESEAEKFEDDIQAINQYRSNVERKRGSSARKILTAYYNVLCLIETRFPISRDIDHINSVSFTWYDAFKENQKAVEKDIRLEKAAILFNIGASYSQAGLSYSQSSDNRKEACRSFVAAAGAFKHLSTTAAVGISRVTSITVDLSVACASMLEKLMLAQAQECFLDTAIANGTSPGVCSKISFQLYLFYEEVLSALGVEPLKKWLDKGWTVHAQLKKAIFYSEACYRYSLKLHEEENIGEEIARLNSGAITLSKAKKDFKGNHKLLNDLKKVETNIKKSLESAMKQNERIYMMRVPTLSSLPSLPAHRMVNSMEINELLGPSTEKLFVSLPEVL